MASNTKIEWCDASWQVTVGCEKIASGCRNCYAIRDTHRMAGNPNPKISEPRKGLTRRVVPDAGPRAVTQFAPFVDWTGVVRTLPQNLAWPLGKRKPLRIFVNSNSDLFHEDVPFEFIAAVYGVMAACPQHTFIILTKRPARMREFHEWFMQEHVTALKYGAGGLTTTISPARGAMNRARVLDETPEVFARVPAWPLPNVIHGYSAANQADLDAGIADLLATPSAVRCLSLEPLVGPVDLEPWMIAAQCDVCEWRGHWSQTVERNNDDVCPECGGAVIDRSAYFESPMSEAEAAVRRDSEQHASGIDWIIVGGESGNEARPCDVSWIRSIVQQCKTAGVPCFVKQLGAAPYWLAGERGGGGEWDAFLIDESGERCYPRLTDRKGGEPSEWPEDLRVREWPEVRNA